VTADQGRNVDKHSEFISMSSIGMVGLTAYFGAFDVAKLEKDQVVVVSGAAGYVHLDKALNQPY
jgi:NADPH-dependent curcumin reductase CurA